MHQALRNACAYGLGFVNLSIDFDKDGNATPILYSIPDVTKVYFDPDSIEIDGSDAREAIIIDIKSKEWIRNTYGEEFVTEKGKKPLIDISDGYDGNCMPLITYYVKTNEGVTVYKLLNQDMIANPVQLNIDRLPIIPIYGEEIFIDDKLSHQGIVRQAKPIQKLIDYSYSQLCERLAKSPKNAWIGTKEALEGYEDYYKNFDKSVNPLLIYNKYDDRKQVNNPPQREDMTIQYADLTTVLQNSLGLMQSVTGIQSIGIPDQKAEITATEALLNVKTFTNNVRNYFDNLKESFKSAGIVFFELLGYDVNVQVESGPADEMQRQTARAELQQLMQLTADENAKSNILGAIISTFDKNQYFRKLNESLTTDQPPIPPQIQQQLQQLQQQLQQAGEANKELQNQLQQAQCELLANRQSNEVALKTKEMELQTDLMKFRVEMEYKYGKMQNDAQIKLATEQMKQNAETTREELKADKRMQEQIVANKLNGGLI